MTFAFYIRLRNGRLAALKRTAKHGTIRRSEPGLRCVLEAVAHEKTTINPSSASRPRVRQVWGIGAFCALLGAALAADTGDTVPPVRPAVETEGYLYKGYPFVPVALHGLTLDWPLSRVLAAAVRLDASRTQDYFTDAMRIVRAFPGWRCDAGAQDQWRAATFSVDDLEAATLDEVITRYFDDDERLQPYPDWFRRPPILQATRSELRRYAAAGQRWFRAGDLDPGGYGVVKPRPVIVSLYKEEERVLVDIDAKRLSAAGQNPAAKVPVVVWYNPEPVKFVDRYGPGVTLKQIVEAFFRDGHTLTLVPQLGFGDHHLVTTLAELRDELDYVPDLEDVSDERVEALTAEFNAVGFGRPLPVALFRVEGDRAVRAVESDRIPVAQALGIERVPVAFFFVDNDRRRGDRQRVDCDVVLCRAAGGDPLRCAQLPQVVEFGVPSVGQPGGAAPTAPPPVSPPPTPLPPPPVSPPPAPPLPPQVVPPPPPASP